MIYPEDRTLKQADFIMQKLCVELKNTENSILFKGFLYVREITSKEIPEDPIQNSNGDGKNNGQYNTKGELLMTDKQKRELFRQIAERGTEKEEALEKLKEHFGVEFLKDATYSQAQTLIDKMNKDKEEKK